MSGLLDQLLAAPPAVVVILVAVIVFVEDALFVGFVIPGETAAILGGVAASLGHVPLPAVVAVVIAAAIVGDTVGYEVGRHLGTRLLTLRVFNRRRERLEQAQAFLARRGGMAVFLGRWVAFFRAVMPALAGTARMPYPRFLAFNAAGGIVWGGTVVTLGYLAGQSYAQVAATFGRVAALVVAAIAVTAVVVWQIRRHRAEASES